MHFAAAADTKPGKRPVREIVGLPTELNDQFSSRRSAIEHRVGQLAKQFQTEHGREPTAVEMLAISQQATLETRQAKHEPRSLAEQRHTWRTEAIEIIGSQRKLSRLIAEITGHSAGRQQRDTTAEWVDEQAAAVIATVCQSRSTWQINHVRAETQRLLRYTNHHGGAHVVDRIVAAALGAHSIAVTTHADTEMGEPAPLRRRDAASVYTTHDTTIYTSTDMLAAERRILAAAATGGGRVADDASVGLALLEQHAQYGVDLNDGQQQLVRAMATSGARVQLALAPAGTGKTTAMAALAAAWRNSGGTVMGLAPTASAAEVLGQDLGTATDTIAKLVQLAEPSGKRSGPPPSPDDPARTWFDAIDADTLLIVDEAGMASTADLDAVIGYAMANGASVRLIGDDQQLASISAGGVLRDIAARHDALPLNTVVRFTHPDIGESEGAASLALRDGDPAGLAFYIDHRRVHVGADNVAADMAYQAWADDLAAGRDAILLAPTNDLVAELNERARLDRLATTVAAPGGSTTVTLGDGLTASIGDWITTRSNARWLGLSGGAWVKNGHRWVIRARARRRIVDGHPAARQRRRQGGAPARRLRRRPHHPGLRQHHQQRPRRHRRHLPHRRLRPAHPPTALRGADPRQARKPRVLLHRRSRPPPHPDTQSHPPPHRGGHPLGDPAPRRRPSVRPQRRRRRNRPVRPPARRGRHVRRRPHLRRRTHRRAGHHGPHRRRRPRHPRHPHRTTRLARAAAKPRPAGHRRPRPHRRPPPGRRHPAGRPHRRRRRAGLAAQSPHRIGRPTSRAAALAARHPRRAAHPPPVGHLP